MSSLARLLTTMVPHGEALFILHQPCSDYGATESAIRWYSLFLTIPSALGQAHARLIDKLRTDRMETVTSAHIRGPAELFWAKRSAYRPLSHAANACSETSLASCTLISLEFFDDFPTAQLYPLHLLRLNTITGRALLRPLIKRSHVVSITLIITGVHEKTITRSLLRAKPMSRETS